MKASLAPDPTPAVDVWSSGNGGYPAQPRIVAVIPLYNGENYIETALRSTLDQTLPATEIVVVDDGSTDNGAALVEQFANRDVRVRLIRKANGGQSSARNAAVKETTCDFVAFLDQDDAWYPRHLELLYQPFRDDTTGRLGFTYGDLDEIDVHSRLINVEFLTTLDVPHPKRSIIDCLKKDMFVLPGASLTQVEVFRKVGGFDEQLIGYEDDDLFRRIFEAGCLNAFVPCAVGRWRIHAGSTSYSRKMNVSRMIYARKLMRDYPNDPAFSRFYVRDFIAPRFAYIIYGEWLKALRMRDREFSASLRTDLIEMIKLVGPSPKRNRVNLLLKLTSSWRLFEILRAVTSRFPGYKRLYRSVT